MVYKALVSASHHDPWDLSVITFPYTWTIKSSLRESSAMRTTRNTLFFWPLKYSWLGDFYFWTRPIRLLSAHSSLMSQEFFWANLRRTLVADNHVTYANKYNARACLTSALPTCSWWLGHSVDGRWKGKQLWSVSWSWGKVQGRTSHWICTTRHLTSNTWPTLHVTASAHMNDSHQWRACFASCFLGGWRNMPQRKRRERCCVAKVQCSML